MQVDRRQHPRLTRAGRRFAVLLLGFIISPASLCTTLSAERPLPPHIVEPASASTSTSPWSVAGGGTWVLANRIVRQTGNTQTDPKKYVVPGLTSSGDQSIVAQVRVDSFAGAEPRVGVSLRNDPATGRGYNFVLIPNGRVAFLADALGWGNSCAFPWSYGRWYWMKLAVSGGTLTGKIWSDQQTEAQATVCVQSGWSHFDRGVPGLNGGASGETASFDNVTIGSFADDFNAGGPPPPLQTPAGFLTSRQLAGQIQAKAAALGFDLARFVDIMQTTAQGLVCAQNPGVCLNYVPGAFVVVPSPHYNGGTWMRDATWTLGALNDAGLFASLTSTFASTANGTTGQIATLIATGIGPGYGAGGQGNPLPDDDSSLMYAIAARLGWQTVASQSYLNNVYSWIRSHAAGDGRYPATSHGWLDSFYPLGTGGPASVKVSANMQGLYAVALRALKDLGVGVPQIEIDSANAQYAALVVNGRMRSYETSDLVDVSALLGEALSLFIWNQPILSDSVVQSTIASFTEVYDPGKQFVGYKVLSTPEGSFLSPNTFPVENGGAGTLGGNYQNGGSWMLYDVLALYAAARHDIPSMRDTYLDRLVRRLAAELRAGVGSTPANKSNEFLCTAAGNPGDPCGPAGSAAPERADYGWNAFVVRLLSDQMSAEPSVCVGCPAVAATPSSLRFSATKAGPSGALTAVTPAQTATVLFPGVPGAWTATVNQTWIQLTGASGTGSGQFEVSIVNPVNVIGDATNLTAAIRVTPADGATAGAEIPVTLQVDQAANPTAASFGQIDTPAQNAPGLQGAIGVTGWALDDVGVAGVKIYRDCLPFDNPASCQVQHGFNVVFIGDAAFVPGARPDVEADYPGYPQAYRAGWGYLMLTNMLPHVPTAQVYGGQGPLTLYAIATDVEGHTTLLGRSAGDAIPTAVVLNNDAIAKPFGSIDTPGQGETVSGSAFANFGWALTRDADTTSGNGDTEIPTNGSTMVVFIDGQPTALVAYNQCRGTVGNPVPAGVYCNDDVANVFGNPSPLAVFTTRTSNPTRYRNLDAGRGAIGAYVIDTTKLANGMHSIAWSVTDSAGAIEGIGSRNFIVLNAGADIHPGPGIRDPGSGAARQEREGWDGLGHSLGLRATGSRGANRAPDDAGATGRRDGVFPDPGSRVPDPESMVRGRVGFDLDAPFDELIADASGVWQIRLPELGRVELELGRVDEGYLVVNGELRDLPVGSHLDGEAGRFTWAPGPGFLGTYRFAFIRGGEQILIDVTVGGRVPQEPRHDVTIVHSPSRLL